MMMIPHEIHLTMINLSANLHGRFVEVCKTLGGKPILIELARGQHASQPMLTKVVFVTSADKALAIAQELEVHLRREVLGETVLANASGAASSIWARLRQRVSGQEPPHSVARPSRRSSKLRTKIEIPATLAPDEPLPEKSGRETYFEWHGKVEYTNVDLLVTLCEQHFAHLSRNALKGEASTRFVTLRDYGPKVGFNARVDKLSKALEAGGWPVLKSQREYCIYDNHTSLDRGWLNNEALNIKRIAEEAFIRRAAQFDGPFMLKGSFVGRTYFADPNERSPADMDWAYLGRIENKDQLHAIFGDWVEAVTTLQLDDGAYFRPFSRNAFWRNVDYGIADDDFPTTSTDLTCVIDGQVAGFTFDVSYNLDISEPPVPKQLLPLRGAPFTVAKTVPLPLQVAWKLHQTMFRPRLKDIVDLVEFLRHPSFDDAARSLSIQLLVDECHINNAPIERLVDFTQGRLEDLVPVETPSLHGRGNVWRRELRQLVPPGALKAKVLAACKASGLADYTADQLIAMKPRQRH
jgi:hypothetical protein